MLANRAVGVSGSGMSRSQNVGCKPPVLKREVTRLSGIVEGLLALSRLDAGEAQEEWVPFDLAELAATTADQMSLLAEDKNITVTCDAAPSTNQSAFHGVWPKRSASSPPVSAIVGAASVGLMSSGAI